MFGRLRQSYRNPVTARRYRLAALLFATFAFVLLGVANALDRPGTDSIYEKEGALGILLVFLFTLPMAIVFRYPLAVLIVIMAAFTVHTGLDHEPIWVVQFTALFTFFIAVIRGGDRQSLIALVLAYLAIVASFGVFDGMARSGDVLVQFILFGGIWVIGNLFRTGRIRLESAEQVVVELEAEQDRMARQAVQDERARIARELHDVLGHTLNLVVIQAGAAQRVFTSSPDKALEAVKSIESTSRQALSDVDRMLGILRDPDDPNDAGGKAPSLTARPSMSRLGSLVEDLRATGQSIDLEISGTPKTLAPSIDLSVYRVVQEALTNVMTHAAGAKAHIEIGYSEDLLTVTVSNDGSGAEKIADRSGGGRGIVGMRERTALFGGEFEAGRADDGGWRVHPTFPIGPTGGIT